MSFREELVKYMAFEYDKNGIQNNTDNILKLLEKRIDNYVKRMKASTIHNSCEDFAVNEFRGLKEEMLK